MRIAEADGRSTRYRRSNPLKSGRRGARKKRIAHVPHDDIDTHIYRAARPDVEVKYREGNAADITNAIAAGKLDVCFLHMPISNPAGLSFYRLTAEEFLLVLPVEHPLLKGKSGKGTPTISLKALRDEQFILVPKPGAPGMYPNLIAACKRAGFSPDIAVEVDRMLSNICLVAAGIGVSAVPASMTGFHADAVVYCRIREHHADLNAPLTMVSQKTGMAPAVQHFIADANRIARHKAPWKSIECSTMPAAGNGQTINQ